MKNIIQARRVVLSVFIIAGLLFYTVSMNNVWSSEGAARQVTLKVDGMSCSACVTTIKMALKRLPGVVNADVSYKEKKATVSYHEGKVTLEQMIKAIEDAGYYAELSTGEKR
ncbi:MAG: heavy metal-associated domain-containing protein [Nitrospiraceae bacterium]|nr:heavy metal-associated domain-containing protein [Nitrospiraceae bacterium]